MFDLFLGGSETTTSTIRWLLLHLINYPDIQKKCQDEIQKVPMVTYIQKKKDLGNISWQSAHRKTIFYKHVMYGVVVEPEDH